MSTPVELPALGESVTEGTVSRWLKQVGDTVEADEPLLEVSTDKVDTEIPSPVAGTLLEIKAAEDETVEVGAVLAVIGDASEASGDGDTSGSGDAAAEDEAPAENDEVQEQADAGDQAARTNQQADDPNREDAAEAAEQPAPSADTAQASGGSGTEVKLPELGESVTEGTVSRWLKSVGDAVEVDEPLLEISTDKVDTEIPAPVAGTLLEIRADTDDVVEVGGVLGVIGEQGAAPADGGGEPAGDEPAAQPTSEPDPAEQADDASDADAGDEGGQAPIPTPDDDGSSAASDEPAKPKQTEQPKQDEAKQDEPRQDEPKRAQAGEQQGADRAPAARRAGGDDSGYVTPLVRKLAQQHDVDLSSIEGTGVGGRIRKQDVLAAAESAKAPAPAQQPAASSATGNKAPAQVEVSPKRGTTEKMSRLRKTIATKMVESLQTSAQLTATVEVDLTRVSRLRNAIKDEFAAREGVRISHLAFITKAAIEALKAYPNLNATVDTEAGEITYAAAENVGIAVDTEKGLIVPVIKNAGDLSIAGIAKQISDLAARTRDSKIGPDDLTGGTFTITNYGSAGTLFDTPIINQPQVGILGTGAIVKRPMVISDENLGETIAVRDMMYLNLTYDHRVVDGADAARFLTAVKARLEEGDFGAELGA